MQKLANRILGALLVLVMIITMLPATVFATSETDVFAGWSLTLGEDIGVNFYLSQTAADYTVDITVAGNEAAYTTATKDGYYVVSVNVAAAQMTDLITLTVTNGEQVMHTGEYSVRQYAEIILTGAYDDEVKQMAKQMLNLGAAAQTYFAYNTGMLANKDYEIDTPAAVPTEVPAIALEDNLDGVSLYGMSLLFQSKTAVRFYFVVDGNVADYTFKVKETEYTPVKKDDLYYVEVGNINPQDLGSEMTVTVNDALTVSYNPLTYIVRKYNSDSTSAALKNLVQALYGYHLEALEYQEYQKIIQVGALQQHSNNTPWVKSDSETFIYFNTDAYTATTGEYTSLTADAIKLVRGGEVYSVANPGQGLLVKDTDTQHLLKITPWGMTGGHLPIQAHDYFIIEGRFESTSGDGTTIQIAKSYVYFDGTNVEISTTEPILPTVIDAGTMSAHSTTGWKSSAEAAGNLLFAMADNDAPTGYYRPTDASNVQLIRGGNTYVVGHNLRDTIAKENNAQYVFEFWTIADHKPMVANDILVVEGDFYQESTKTTLNISKTYILLNADGTATFSTEMPTLATVIDAGVMSSHSNGWNADALYFSMAENEAPVGDAIRYTPTAASNLKLIRDGVTYDVGHTARETIVKSSDTGYYIALWVLGDYKPLVANDILVVEGNFTNAANNTTLNISKSYVLINADGTASFSTEMPTLTTVIDAGTMSAHSTTGWKSSADAPGNLLFAMADNDAPSGYYRPTDASNVQLIRGGNTYVVGHNLRDTIAKENNAQYVFEFWTIADHKPMVANDILVVEGDFYQESTKTTLNISKTYILLNADGTATFSTEMPTLATVIDAGVMSSHSNGWNADALYFSMAENEAPVGDAIRYTPTAASNLKLIRDGVTYDVGHTARETIVKSSDTGYYIALWVLGDYKPLVANDILVVEGNFTNAANNTTLNISKSYVLINADGTASFSTEMPTLQTIVDAGAMSAHADGSASEIYFSLAANSVPVDENAETAYAGSVQLVRSGAVSTVSANIYKLDEGYYYLELDGVELADGDYLVVEGAFSNANNGYTMNITKTYVLVDGETLVYSETEPVFETEFALTGLTNHSNGWSADGIYISHDAHGATVGTDWSVRYRPVSADVIKLVRDGETFNIGQPAGDTLVVYGNTNLYFETKAWTTQGGKLPFVDGDLIIIEGKFKHEASGSILAVEKTEIYVSNGSLIFNPILAGTLRNHANGVSGEGVYATMAENAAPYDGWNIEYTPVTAGSYYVIRNGEQIDIGIPGRGTLVKYNATDYFLKINAWCTNNFAYTTDDIIVVDGFWKNDARGVTMKIEKTYLYYNGSAWTFATELPSVISGGTMQTHTKGMWGNGISFTMAANDAPFNSDWTLEYKQTSTDNIKIIRGGETISIGIVDRPLIIKISNDEYYLKLEGWTIGNYGLNSTSPITTDDVIIVEGNFLYENVTLNVTKSYVYYNGSAWVCAAEAPVQKNIVDVVELGSHSNGWSTGGFYFTAAANDAPYDTTWALRYKPVSADVIKCISGDTTTNVGNTGGETIVKYSETAYYVEGWAVGSANLAAGNTFVIEGQFYNAANDVYIDVEKTYIILNADGTTTVLTDADKYINAGAMSAYSEKNWFNTNYTALYFVLESNNAPADEGWSVRYKPASANNVKLVRDGTTYTIGNTGAETIVKIADGTYALALDSWWWSAYAPIRDGDQLIIEGEFSNASNGYILNITKTYITFVSNAEDNVIFNAAADTEFGDVLLPSTNDTLTIGVWNGSYHVFEDQQLKELKAAGITKIMGIDTQWIGTTNVNAWLDRVYSYGISVIMDLRSWDGETVPAYASHPGVLGFLMYDEPCATEFDNLADLKAKFDAVMPADKLFYVNLFPSCAAKSSLYGGWTIGKNYETHYVQQFLDKLGVEVLSWDNYSLLDGNGIRTDYFYNFEVMASKTAEKWYTMLSSGHSTTTTSYATPTADELRWQMAVAMTYGVQNIDHYTYVSHEDDYSCMVEYDTWKPTALYYDILQVDNEYLAWDNIYMAYNWIGVGTYSANSNNSMLTQLENSLNLANHGITATSASENLLIGVFENNGNKAYMVTNAGSAGSTTVGDGKNFSMADTSVTLTLAAGDYKCAAVIDNGEITYVAVNNNQVTLNVEAYEGVFVIPVLN